MALIQTQIYTRLSTYAPLTALLASLTGGKLAIYPTQKPLDAKLPAVTFMQVSAERFPAMGVTGGNVKARYQFSSWAMDYDTSRNVNEEVRNALQRFSETGALTIETIFIDTEQDLFENDTQQYHVALDARIAYIE